MFPMICETNRNGWPVKGGKGNYSVPKEYSTNLRGLKLVHTKKPVSVNVFCRPTPVNFVSVASMVINNYESPPPPPQVFRRFSTRTRSPPGGFHHTRTILQPSCRSFSQSSRFAEILCADPGLRSGICARILTLKKKNRKTQDRQGMIRRGDDDTNPQYIVFLVVLTKMV